MRKIIISLVILLSLMFSTTFAYNMTEKDTKLINKINYKLNIIYKKSPKKIENIGKKIDKILTGKLKGKENTRIYVLINELKKHIDGLMKKEEENIYLEKILEINDENKSIEKKQNEQKIVNKDCGFYKNIKYKNGDTGIDKRDFDIDNGKIMYYYNIKCLDGKINFLKRGNYYVFCDEGYKSLGKKCVEKDRYEVNIAIKKQFGLNDNEAVIGFTLDLSKNIEKIEIVSIESDGSINIKNNDYKYVMFPEEIKDRDEFYIIAKNDWVQYLKSITYKVIFKNNYSNIENKEPITITKKINLDLGNYRKD